MGLKVPINNPIQTRRRASLSSSKYSIRGRARTQILCSGYNVQLKTRRRNEIRPLNTKRRSTKHCQPLHTEIYTQAGGLEINEYQNKLMYTDYIQPLRNINKLAGKYVYRTTEKHKGQTWNIHAFRTTTSKDEHITTDNSPRTVRCGDKKWAKVRSPGRRGLTFITWSPVIYEL